MRRFTSEVKASFDEGYQDVKETAKKNVKQVKEHFEEKLQPVKEKLQKVTDKKREVGIKKKEFVAKVEDKITQGKDKIKAFRVDLGEAKKDEKFHEFLAKTGKELDWEVDQGDVREAFVQYERTSKVKKNIDSLFKGKASGLVGESPELSKQIEAHILELAKTNPDKLRGLENQVDRVIKSEELIATKQAEIDKYKEKGGKQGIEDKIDTLKKATSFRRVVSKVFELKTGRNRVLAHENAKTQYGYKDKREMKKALKELEGDLSKISKLEDAKRK